MKHFNTFFLILILGVLQSKISCGQVIVISLPLGNCISCEIPLNNLSPVKTNIPAIIIFPESYKIEAKEIDEAHQLTSRKYKILFSDYWAKKIIKYKLGTVLAFNSYGAKVSLQPLGVFLKADQIDLLVSKLLPSTYLSVPRSINVFNDGCMQQFRMNTSTFYKNCNDTFRKFLVPITANQSLTSQLAQSGVIDYSNADPSLYNPQFKGTIEGINVASMKNGAEALIYKVYHFRIRGDDTALIEDYGLANFEDSKFMSISLINSPAKSLNLSYSPLGFYAPHLDTLYMLCMPTKEIGYESAENRFLGIWTLKNGQYVYAGLDEVKIPNDRPGKLGYKQLGLFASNYPYILQNESNYLQKIHDRNQIKLELLNQEGTEAIKFSHFNFGFSEDKSKILLISKIDNHIHLLALSITNGKLLKSIRLHDYLLNPNDITDYNTDKANGNLYVSYKSGSTSVIPMSLLLGIEL